MTGIRDALKVAATELSRAGIEGGRLDARLLLGHVLGRAVWPHEEAPLDDADQAAAHGELCDAVGTSIAPGSRQPDR